MLLGSGVDTEILTDSGWESYTRLPFGSATSQGCIVQDAEYIYHISSQYYKVRNPSNFFLKGRKEVIFAIG